MDTLTDVHQDTRPGDGMRARILTQGILRALDEIADGHTNTARMFLQSTLENDKLALHAQEQRLTEATRLRQAARAAKARGQHAQGREMEKRAYDIEQLLKKGR